MQKICQHNFIYTSVRRIFFYWTIYISKLLVQAKRFIRKMREEDFITPASTPPKGWGSRHTVVVLCFLGSAMSYAMRFNLSIAIVAMVNRTIVHSPNKIGQPAAVACPHLIQPPDYHNISMDASSLVRNLDGGGGHNTLELEKADQGEFLWSEAQQGLILGSFFWGYILTQFPGGLLAKKFGGKWPFGFGLLLCAICTLATPWAARISSGCLIFIRIVEGLGCGVQISCQTALIAAWSPLNERSFIASLVYGGTFVGTAVTLIVSGYLINGNFLGGGWESIFYTTGLATCIWFVLWAFFVYNSPQSHPRISTQERNYIESSLGVNNMTSRTDTKVPWGEILTSVPVWANVVAHVCHCWGIYTLLTEMPTYMRTVLHYPIEKNSWLSAIPYLSSWGCGLLFANLADVALRKNLIKLITVRKTAQIIAHGMSGITLVALAYSNCDRFLSVSFLILSVSFLGMSNSGFIINYVDLSPQYASIIVGAVNMIANLCGIGAPYVAGKILDNDPSVENWRMVYLICAAVLFFGAFFYTVFAQGTVQPWNNYKYRENNSRIPEVKSNHTMIDASNVGIHHHHNSRKMSDDLKKLHS